MAINEIPSTQSTDPDPATCYQQDGHYYKGQRVLHQEFGLGTVTQVRRDNIRVVMDQGTAQPRGKKARRFASAPLSLRDAMAANYFSLDDMDTLCEWNEEDLKESVALVVHGIARAILTVSSMSSML